MNEQNADLKDDYQFLTASKIKENKCNDSLNMIKKKFNIIPAPSTNSKIKQKAYDIVDKLEE